MPRHKYIQDYRLVETVDERGHIRTDYEYTGKAYRFVLDDAEVRREKRLALILCAVSAAAFVGALIPVSAAMRTMYTALPFAVSALPLGILIESLISASRAKAPLQRITAEKLQNRVPACAVFAALLSGVTLPGELVSALTGTSLLSGDVIFCLCALVESASCAVIFARRRRLDTTAD